MTKLKGADPLIQRPCLLATSTQITKNTKSWMHKLWLKIITYVKVERGMSLWHKDHAFLQPQHKLQKTTKSWMHKLNDLQLMTNIY